MNLFNRLVEQQIEETAFRPAPIWKQVSNPLLCLVDRRVWDLVSKSVSPVGNSTLIRIDRRTWEV